MKVSDLKTIFCVNFVSLIYKYSEFKDLVSVYKEFLQKYNLSFKDAGYKSLEEIGLENHVVIRKEDGMIYVKGYENYLEDKPDFNIDIKFNGILFLNKALR